MSHRQFLPFTAVVLCFSLSGVALAADNRITPTLDSVQIQHNGQTVTIERGHDPHATLPEAFQKTNRGCPPFCVQPMIAVAGVETVGELDVLNYLQRMSQGDTALLLVDSRTPDWVMRGTIPGSINIPWNKMNRDALDTPENVDAFEQILRDQFGARRNAQTGTWDFSQAKTLILFCNGIWCAQSTTNLKTLVEIGYPLPKLKWYRGGMQDWLSVGLTSVQP